MVACEQNDVVFAVGQQRSTLAELIHTGIEQTIARTEGLRAIAVPWGSGDDIAPGCGEILFEGA